MIGFVWFKIQSLGYRLAMYGRLMSFFSNTRYFISGVYSGIDLSVGYRICWVGLGKQVCGA